MRIHNYKQFNESYVPDPLAPGNLDLNIKEKNEIEEKIYKKIDSMNSQELDSIFNELEKMARKLKCDVDDLSNPVFVKEHLDQITSQSVIEEGFFSDMKDKVYRFFSRVFEWGAPLGAFIMIILNSINGNVLGIFASAMALAIAILASAYVAKKRSDRFK
jgi:hypothetical protein